VRIERSDSGGADGVDKTVYCGPFRSGAEEGTFDELIRGLSPCGRKAVLGIQEAQTSTMPLIGMKQSAPLAKSQTLLMRCRPADTSWQSSIRDPSARATETR
jgi:hypothetical protein